MLASSPTERSHGYNLLHSSQRGLRIVALEWPLLSWGLGSLGDDLCILRCSRFQYGITMWKLLLKETRLWRWDMGTWGHGFLGPINNLVVYEFAIDAWVLAGFRACPVVT